MQFLGSIVVSIPACHAGDRGSIPRRGGQYFCQSITINYIAFGLVSTHFHNPHYVTNTSLLSSFVIQSPHPSSGHPTRHVLTPPDKCSPHPSCTHRRHVEVVRWARCQERRQHAVVAGLVQEVLVVGVRRWPRHDDEHRAKRLDHVLLERLLFVLQD